LIAYCGSIAPSNDRSQRRSPHGCTWPHPA
jgi:hypothetical protein